MLHPQSGRIGEKAFQKVQIPHKIGMFVRHQKATAYWRGSIWPNMEGKNAAFSRNQTGKKKKKKGEGLLACCVHSKIELSHSLHSGHRVGSLSKQHDWWWCWTCRDISANTHTNTHTCTSPESWKRGTPILSLRWQFILNTHKSFLHFHIWALCRSLSSTLRIGAPWKGTFLMVKKQPSQTPPSSA